MPAHPVRPSRGGRTGWRPSTAATALLLLVALCAGCGSAAPAPSGVEPVAVTPRSATVPEPVPAAGPAESDRLADPARVRLAGIDVDAVVVPVGVDDVGDMEVPLDVQTVGWYRFGPEPGAIEGSSVLSGHVDDRVQGRGAFYDLADTVEGEAVEVELADGTVERFRVTSVERINKDELPVERLFARTGPPVLTIVTCGGDFDRESRSYRENVVVTAEPA